MTEQKTAIVTGASRGIGHGVAERFRDLGWRVITVSRQALPVECPWHAEQNTHVELDLSDLDQITKTVDALRPLLGGSKLHALINNAGISPKGPGGERVNSLTTDLKVWQEMYNTNFYAPLILTRGFAQELSSAKGSVVNLCSIAGYRVHPFAGAAYATSKAALAALTREMAADMAPMGVRVCHTLEEGIRGADVIIMLRLQNERMSGALLPSTQEFFKSFGLTPEKLQLAKPDAIVMHPGPINRGVEIDSEVVDGGQSVILPQVTFGIAVRMAAMSIVAGNEA